jgi:hypothetical protein
MAEDKTVRRRRSSPILAGAAGLLLGLLACRPIFVIGWGELAIIILLAAFLLGPILFRFFRTWNAYQESQKKKRN